MAENFRAVLDRNEIPPPKVPMDEIEELWISAEGVKVSNDVKEALTELREKIHDQGVEAQIEDGSNPSRFSGRQQLWMEGRRPTFKI